MTQQTNTVSSERIKPMSAGDRRWRTVSFRLRLGLEAVFGISEGETWRLLERQTAELNCGLQLESEEMFSEGSGTARLAQSPSGRSAFMHGSTGVSFTCLSFDWSLGCPLLREILCLSSPSPEEQSSWWEPTLGPLPLRAVALLPPSSSALTPPRTTTLRSCSAGATSTLCTSWDLSRSNPAVLRLSDWPESVWPAPAVTPRVLPAVAAADALTLHLISLERLFLQWLKMAVLVKPTMTEGSTNMTDVYQVE